MKRLIAALCMALIGAAQAGADQLYREDLRLPMAVAGLRGLEAMLLRPAGPGRYPLAVLTHGAPRNPADRAAMSPYRAYPHAAEFARRGFAALVVMRRGYGTSDGTFAEGAGPCGRRNYWAGGNASALDLRAAIAAMAGRADVSTEGMIVVGVSAGGFAGLALAAAPPPGLAAVISFAGGRGSRADDDVCDEEALIEAFATYGRTARVPTLWVYAANDKYFGPELARRMHAAFTASGGRAELIEAPPFGSDGHKLYSAAGIPIWTPMVDKFLRAHHLVSREPIALTVADLPPPPQLSAAGHAGFTAYLAGSPHKAFAVAPTGAFAFRSAQRSTATAEAEALKACGQHAPDCALYAVDDRLVSR
jgi:dienelactone hydrolase